MTAAAILLPAVAALSWSVLGGDASSATESTPACTPSGTALSIAAKDKKFDKDCLAAPADQPFTIAFDNRDTAVPHNVAIYDRPGSSKALFKGEIVFGPNTVTYSVPAQPAGTYEFRCDPHDDSMIGTFVVGDGRATATTAPPSTTTTTGPLGLPKLLPS
jgi:plastocyanin